MSVTQNEPKLFTVDSSSIAAVASAGQIKVVKQGESANIPDWRASALKRINDMQNELGRLTRLLGELKTDVLNSEG